MKKVFGGIIHKSSRRGKRKDGGALKDIFRYKINGKPALFTIKRLLPYLITKRKQALEALRLEATMGGNRKEYNLSKKERALRRSIFLQLKELKKF